jgi:hypothetical protein
LAAALTHRCNNKMITVSRDKEYCQIMATHDVPSFMLPKEGLQ